jgi:hypothetical protein
MRKALVCELLLFIDFFYYLLKSIAGFAWFNDVGERHIERNLNNFVFKGQIFAGELSKLILKTLDGDFGVIGFKVQPLIVDGDVVHDSFTELKVYIGTKPGVAWWSLGGEGVLNLFS